MSTVGIIGAIALLFVCVASDAILPFVNDVNELDLAWIPVSPIGN